MTQPKTPNSRRNLDLAIDRLCAKTGDEPGRVKRLLAAAIVGQMLPDGAAKGGNALKIRFGKDSMCFAILIFRFSQLIFFGFHVLRQRRAANSPSLRTSPS